MVGIGIGFAAQATLANLVSGVDHRLRTAHPPGGQRRYVETEFGTVESIGLFYTNIRTWDNRRLVIPNKLLSDRAIRNYTLIDPQTPAVVVLRLDYGADIGLVRSAAPRGSAGAPGASCLSRSPTVQVTEADDTGLSVRLIAWCCGPSPSLRPWPRTSARRRLARLTEAGAMGSEDGSDTVTGGPPARHARLWGDQAGAGRSGVSTGTCSSPESRPSSWT